MNKSDSFIQDWERLHLKTRLHQFEQVRQADPDEWIEILKYHTEILDILTCPTEEGLAEANRRLT